MNSLYHAYMKAVVRYESLFVSERRQYCPSSSHECSHATVIHLVMQLPSRAVTIYEEI